jgi:drug/metabolite transporter (DMT)-like permease
MPWQIPIISKIFLGNILLPILIKVISGLPSQKKNLWLQFAFCLLFSVIAFFAITAIWGLKEIQNSYLLLAVVFIGFLNCFACYCSWKAIDLSLGKTGLFTQLDDVIALTIGVIFLNEKGFIDCYVLCGIVLCFCAAFLFLSSKQPNKSSNYSLNKKLMGYVLGYSFIWGFAFAAQRYCAVKNLPPPLFLISWYIGSFLGASLLLTPLFKLAQGKPTEIIGNERLERWRKKFGRFRKTSIAIMSFTVWLSMACLYWGAELTPIIGYQPLYLVAEIIFPVLAGLLLFGEKKELSKREQIAFVIGITGSIIIGVFLKV